MSLHSICATATDPRRLHLTVTPPRTHGCAQSSKSVSSRKQEGCSLNLDTGVMIWTCE